MNGLDTRHASDAVETSHLNLGGQGRNSPEIEDAVAREDPASSSWLDWPKQVYFIMGNEICERFSFYGMRAILVVYMTGSLGMQDSSAESAFHMFTAACYLFPLVGAWIADNYFGKYPVILYLSLVYCTGHAVLALLESRLGLFLGLSLITMGTGGIKPCVAALVGDQFDETNSHMLATMFSAFYWCINVGSFLSMASIPVVLQISGSSLAFAIPGIFMGIALAVFLAGRKMYIMIDPKVGVDRPKGFLEINWYCLLRIADRKQGQGFWHPAYEKFSKEDIEAAQSITSLLSLLACVAGFQALFDQNSSTWVIQAQKMDLRFFKWHMPASQMQAANPVLVLVLIPLFDAYVYPFVSKLLGYTVRPLQKMGFGLVLSATPFFYLSIFQALINAGKQPHVLWQAPAYFLLTVSEILVSVTMLQFSYSQAPTNMKSTVMSLSLLTVFGGNLLDAFVMDLELFNEFWSFIAFALFILFVACIFILLASTYTVRDFPRNARSESMKDIELATEFSAKDNDSAQLLRQPSFVRQ